MEKQIKIKATFLLLNFSLFISLTGCVKDPIYNTDHPEQAQVTITTTWNDKGAGIEKPATYIVVTGIIKEEAKADIYTLNTLLNPGNRTFYLYNSVTEIPVADGIARVNTVTAPLPDQRSYIESLPGWLFTGIVEKELEKDNEYQLTATMHQQVRQLTLVLEPQGTSADRITAITAYLSGVASQFNINTNTHSEPANTAFEFTKITGGDDAGKWSATIRLLGTAGEEQKLTGTIVFNGGSPEDIILESDLSSALADFNKDKKTPLRLGARIVEVPTGAGFTATITDWEKVNKGSGIAK